MATIEGYSAGFATQGGKWLTIPGSAHISPTLFDYVEEARDEWKARWPQLENLEIRKVRAQRHDGVTVTGIAYLIID